MDALRTLSADLALAVSALRTADFPRHLAQALQRLTGAEDVTLLRYRNAGMPSIGYSSPPSVNEQSTLDSFVTGPFLLDPFYRAAAFAQKFGVFQLKELAPGGFKDSEYYQTWYRHCHFSDECGLLIALDDGFVNLALCIETKGQRFTKKQLNTLKSVFPLVESLANAHWCDTAPSSTDESSLREQLHMALQAFGSSVLTRRERQVIELVLLGNSTRIIAEKLGISTETVKLHRKHAYAKLDVSSQAGLFILFMEALAHSPDGGAVDPLIAYHSKPVST